MYAMFGFLLVNFILQVVVISLLAIVQVYMQLSYQNYEWWWRSFAVGGSGGIYMALYAIYFLVTKMNVKDLNSDATFLIYVYVFIGLYACTAGFIATQASYMFVSSMYKNLRSE